VEEYGCWGRDCWLELVGMAEVSGCSRPQLCIVIPARNEGSRLGRVVRSLPRRLEGCGPPIPLVVDDGSDDDTALVVQNRALVVRHPEGRGKGAALKTGCDLAFEHGCDLFVMMDGDGQHDPADLPALVRPLVLDQADLALGFRQFSGQMPLDARFANAGLTSAFSLLFGRRFRDTQCGLRAFTARAYERLRWTSNGYSVETEMLIRAARSCLRVAEIPIRTLYQERRKGTTATDGARILARMLGWRLAIS
jgi:glycosyltransferase involved in cell wall biosynthesis